MNKPNLHIVAIIISYNPNAQSFLEILESINEQVDSIIVVDNASTKIDLNNFEKTICQFPKLKFIPLPENVGIAAAQNEGLKCAEQYDYSHILFLDHDSIPDPDMVARLVEVERELLGRNVNVGAVGPTSVDRRTGSASGFVKRSLLFIKRKFPQKDESCVETDFLISSGTLTRREVLQNVGWLNAEYFIDHVDTEWCFRVTHAGYKLFGVKSARLNHRLGENVVRIWLIRWREIPQHNNFRYYYIFRNTIVMIKNTPMDVSWKLAHLYRLLMFFSFFSLVGDNKIDRIKMIFKGINDGLNGKMGEMS